jgi:hypothetical protein
MRNPSLLILLGLFLMLAGVVLPFMMILRVLPTSYFLSFFSWGSSVTGLALGMVGVAYHVRRGRNR